MGRYVISISEATGASLDTLVPSERNSRCKPFYPGTVLRFSADQKEVTVDNGTEQHSYRVQNNNEVEAVETTGSGNTNNRKLKQLKQLKLLKQLKATETTQAAAASSSQGGYYLTVEATASLI